MTESISIGLKKKEKFKDSLAFFTIRFISYVILATIFISLGSITLHEIGHSILAFFYECTPNNIVFSLGGMPYTDINCIEGTNIGLIALGGIIITTLFSGLLFIVSRGIMRYLSIIIFGFGFVIASNDLYFLSVQSGLIIVINSLGYLIFSLGIVKIMIILFKSRV